MPLAAVVGGRIFCCHGGLSPELHSLDQIDRLPRPADVPRAGLCCDLLWADPEYVSVRRRIYIGSTNKGVSAM